MSTKRNIIQVIRSGDAVLLVQSLIMIAYSLFMLVRVWNQPYIPLPSLVIISAFVLLAFMKFLYLLMASRTFTQMRGKSDQEIMSSFVHRIMLSWLFEGLMMILAAIVTLLGLSNSL